MHAVIYTEFLKKSLIDFRGRVSTEQGRGGEREGARVLSPTQGSVPCH